MISCLRKTVDNYNRGVTEIKYSMHDNFQYILNYLSYMYALNFCQVKLLALPAYQAMASHSRQKNPVVTTWVKILMPFWKI